MLRIHARKLAARLMPSEQWKGIYCRQPWRSGTRGAAGVSWVFVMSIPYSSYDHDNQRGTEGAETRGDGEGFIVIDDLVDRGTAVAIRECDPKRTSSRSLQKPAGRPAG